jgi:hypothetical protein
MTDEEYCETPQCPRCLSTDVIHGIDVTFGGDYITQPMTCEFCGNTWDSIYTLTGFEENV